MYGMTVRCPSRGQVGIRPFLDLGFPPVHLWFGLPIVPRLTVDPSPLFIGFSGGRLTPIYARAVWAE